MKNLITASAIALTALTGAASAMSLDTPNVESQIHEYAPDADLTGVSDATIIQALAVIADADDSSDAYIGAQVRSVLKNG